MVQHTINFSKRQLQKLLAGYRYISRSMEKTLCSWGFELRRNKRHDVLVYWIGNRRLSFVTPKSASDYRAGLNFASVIFNRISQAVAAA